jgi:hypothetical protein
MTIRITDLSENVDLHTEPNHQLRSLEPGDTSELQPSPTLRILGNMMFQDTYADDEEIRVAIQIND